MEGIFLNRMRVEFLNYCRWLSLPFYILLSCLFEKSDFQFKLHLNSLWSFSFNAFFIWNFFLFALFTKNQHFIVHERWKVLLTRRDTFCFVEVNFTLEIFFFWYVNWIKFLSVILSDVMRVEYSWQWGGY